MFFAKIKVDSQEKKLREWKEYFKNLLGNSPLILDKHTQGTTLSNEASNLDNVQRF